MRAYVRNVRHFVLTDDWRRWKKTGPLEVPYFSPAMLGGWLRYPPIHRLLPAVLRAPLPLTEKAGTVSTFDRSTAAGDPRPVLDSYAAAAPRRGRFESEPVQCRRSAAALRDRRARRARRGCGWRSEASQPARRRAVAAGPAAGGWRSVIPCPDGPFTVVAEDTSRTSSFGFRPPTEIARGSAMAGAIVQRRGFVGRRGGAGVAGPRFDGRDGWRDRSPGKPGGRMRERASAGPSR